MRCNGYTLSISRERKTAKGCDMGQYKVKRIKTTYGTQIVGMVRENGGKWDAVNVSCERNDCDMVAHFSELYESKGYTKA